MRLLAAALLVSLLGCVSRTSGPRPPNVVFILADDMAFGDLGCTGAKDIRTPNIDRLAEQGVRFDRFYASGPECTPTRAALLTGRYPQRVGGLECAIGTGNVGRYDDAIRLRSRNDLGLPAGEVSIARLLRDAGYATGVCGKWHLGYEDKFAPGGLGFDHAFYGLGGGMDYFHHTESPDSGTMLRLNGAPIRRDGYFTDLVAEESVRFVNAHKDRPFFLYVPFTAPHSPFQGPGDRGPEPLPAGSPLWNQRNGPPAVYAAMIERMDEAVGRILAALDESGAAGRTLVVFTSDNGGTASARPTPFRGLKGSTFEGGLRVPCIVRWPGVLPAGAVTPQVAVTMDLTASIARAAGAPPPGEPFDGIDVLERLRSNQPPLDRALFWRGRRGSETWWAARDGALKYVARQNGTRREQHLFDVDRDPGETRDLIAERAEDARRLESMLARWETEVRPRR